MFCCRRGSCHLFWGLDSENDSKLVCASVLKSTPIHTPPLFILNSCENSSYTTSTKTLSLQLKASKRDPSICIMTSINILINNLCQILISSACELERQQNTVYPGSIKKHVAVSSLLRLGSVIIFDSFVAPQGTLFWCYILYITLHLDFYGNKLYLKTFLAILW